MPVLDKYVSTRQDAEDAFTEAMTVYWLHWKRGDIKNQDNIPAFICTTAIRLLYKQHKKNAPIIVDSLLSDRKAVEDLLYISMGKPLNYKKTLLQNAFSKLGEACQKLLIVKYIYEYSYEEIAEDFGHKNFHVSKTQTHRCIKRVKKYFADELAKKQKEVG